MVVGIDVSKDWLDAAWREGEMLRCAKYDYTDQGLDEFLEETPSDGLFVMEATGTYHARAALRLLEVGRAVSVVNPLVIKRYGQMKLSRATIAHKLLRQAFIVAMKEVEFSPEYA